jgi:hypothetical protein
MRLRRGVMYSVLFHLFLVLIFSFINCDLKVTPPEPIELGISTISEEGIFEEEGMAAVASAPEEEGGNIPIDMPQIESPPIEGKETSEIEKENFSEGILDTVLSEIGESGKELEPKVSSSGDESLGVGGKKGIGFSISGALSQREIIKQVIPSYPKGYEERTKVVVKLTVAPDGNVSKLLLLKTGGAVFDNITLEALREWRWERLPVGSKQVYQEGVITFFYELK